MNKSYLKIIGFAFSVMFLFGCEKRKTEKKLIGEWIVTEMLTDNVDMLKTEFRTDKIKLANCTDTIAFVVFKKIQVDLLFTKQKNFKRTIRTNYMLPDTSMISNCTIGFKDSLITEEQTGKWQLSGESSLQMIFDKSSEVNKITKIDDRTMKWETDIVVNQGIVSFNGIVNTTLTKVN